MLTSITLQNFKSFGRETTVPLEPITALVGPNNSGKSSFMSVARFVQNAVIGGLEQALRAEGGLDFLLHRPRVEDSPLSIAWTTPKGSYRGNFGIAEGRLLGGGETLRDAHEDPTWVRDGTDYVKGSTRFGTAPFEAVARLFKGHADTPVLSRLCFAPLVKLSLEALRRDSEVIADPKLQPDGAGLAAVLGLWRGSEPTLSASLDEFLHRCIPEVQHVLVKPAPVPGHQRLWIAQNDREQFDAQHASDGLLSFTALAMHVIGAPLGTTFFVEEPEACIHPRRLRHLVDLMRTAVTERGCQFILATHSTVLLNELKETPERIMLFRRSREGTEVKRATDIPQVVEALQTSTPGELLETAFFEGIWPSEGTGA